MNTTKRRKRKRREKKITLFVFLALFAALIFGLLCLIKSIDWNDSEIQITEDPYVIPDFEPTPTTEFDPVVIVTDDEIPEYSGKPYVEINNNVPYFLDEEYTTVSYEYYGPLDELGRCTEAEANIALDLFPEDNRESISSVKPSGWQAAKYDFIDGNYLYNRCHLIAFMLTGENANEKKSDHRNTLSQH